MRKPLSTMNPVFYFISVSLRRLKRNTEFFKNRKQFATTLNNEQLPFRVYKHQSVLIRKLGDSDLRLQENKVTNLKLAVEKINGVTIKPGETFSFCYLIGKPTKRKGYKVGMQLSQGEAIEGVGGGICQIANLIHWLTLHSELTTTERHHHSFDPFPDSGRVVPFGCGASIFYNYLDYQLTNNTPHTFQFNFWFDEKCINGDLRSDHNFDFKYHVESRDEKFVKVGDDFFRQNEIWREKLSKNGGTLISSELIQKNNALVKYTPQDYINTAS